MELRAGYKRTDIGVIPNDWDAATIGDVAHFSGGSQPPKYTFKFKPIAGYVRLIQIRDYKSDDFETYIPENLARKNCTGPYVTSRGGHASLVGFPERASR